MEHSLQNASTFADRLKALSADLVRWREEADRLRALTDQALSAQQVEQEMLVNVERSASFLYAEIQAFNVLLQEVERQSPAAASELATVDGALRLLLLDVTELGTRLYSIRSTVTPALADVPAQ